MRRCRKRSAQPQFEHGSTQPRHGSIRKKEYRNPIDSVLYKDYYNGITEMI